ncbi:hypothetical protein FHX12_004411 [Rhizobium sp. BK609]|nr:hypothetical protein [Rhizobium sp. BK098]MBB3617418.1 hypothetical protein [Rhizobium sp. BK609]MBB3682746.1 hypothetical protein [Rhizobium sp. BK612]
MAQFSMEIMRLTGSVPRENQQLFAASERLRGAGEQIIETLENHARSRAETVQTQPDVIANRPSKSSHLQTSPFDPYTGFFGPISADIKAGQSIYDEHRTLLQQLSENLNSTRSYIDDELQKKGPRIAEIAADFRKQASAISKDLYRGKLFISIERQILGFWIPFVFSISLLAYSVPQGVVDIKTSISKFMNCSECSFFHRRDKTQFLDNFRADFCYAIRPFNAEEFCP